MEDPEDEKNDGSQKSTQSNPTTPKRIARTVVGEADGLEYLVQRPSESASSAETTSKERTQGSRPQTHYLHKPYKKRETIPDEHTLGMAQPNYGPFIPSTGLGEVANENTQNMCHFATHRLGSPTKSTVIAIEGAQNIDKFANGSLEPDNGYQSFFQKRRLERDRPANPPLADPMSVRHIAKEHPRRKYWPDSIAFEPPMGYREILDRRGVNECQSLYSLHRPHTRDLNIPNEVPERMNQPVNNSVELLMGYQPADPHPGPHSRMFKIPNATARVNSSATKPVERPMKYQPLDPHPGPPSRMFKIPRITLRVNPSATNLVERSMEHQPVEPHPGPPSRMFKIPKVTPRVNSSTNTIERPMEHQPANPPPGHPTRPRNIVDEDLQRIAAAAHLALESPTSPHRVANECLQGMDHIANTFSSRTVAAGTIPPPLPPSVEEAYKKKCIELKRRMQEVEESNDVFRVRKARLARGIRKMRLERAYLLEMLGKRMKKNGSSVDGFPQPYDEESDGSSEGPPTVSFSSFSTSRPSRLKSLANSPTLQPHEKPLRSKRSHRRPVSSPPPNFGHQHPRPIAPSQAHPTSAYEPPRDGFRESAFQHVPTTNGHTTIHYPPHPSTYPPNSAYQPEPQVMRPRPQPPQAAFFNFLEGYIKRHPEKYPHQTHEELLQVAQRAWEETEAEEYKHYYEDKYQRELRAYEEQIAELERREREGMMEVQVPPPPPPQAQQPREAPVGVGGFTSING